MHRFIHADALRVFIDTQRNNQLDNARANQRADNRNRNGDNNAENLCDKQMIVAKNQAIPLCNRIDGAFCKQTRRNTAPDAADAVAAERIQSIIIAKLCLDNRDGKIATACRLESYQ